MDIAGKINSFQSLGAVDGPGIRFVVFFKGCPLNCVCCHNPETRSFDGGEQYTAAEIAQRAERYKEYFGQTGGITLSGGEPIAQPKFAAEIFKICRQKNIHTCLDTSGCALNEDIKELLNYTDLVMLDVKYTNAEDYERFAGGSFIKTLEFLEYLNAQNIPTWIRQVIIPGLNDSDENIIKLRQITQKFSCVEKTELLPFRKICESKYDNLKIEFPLKDTPEPTKEKMQELNLILNG